MKYCKEHRAKGIEQKTTHKGVFRFLFCLFGMMVFSAIAAFANVRDTKHNLSAIVPGPADRVKADSETQLCIFCHTPHNSHPEYPLWNHDMPPERKDYTNYWSDTLQAYGSQEGGSEADAPPIDGFSRLCLGCHDGTIALGAVASMQEDILMEPHESVDAFGKLKPGSAGYLGENLSGGHPVSFIFDEALKDKRHNAGLSELKWPINDPDVKLYPTQGGYGVQCSSCHDPHGNKGAPGEPPLWRKPTLNDVCEVCHESIDFIGH